LLLAYGPDNFHADPDETPLFWLALLIGLASFYARFALIHRGRRMCGQPAIEELAEDASAPIPFLRSFLDDDLLDPAPWMVPFGALIRRRCEESIALPLGTIGQCSAPGGRAVFWCKLRPALSFATWWR
jgi:hypothetical protein